MVKVKENRRDMTSVDNISFHSHHSKY